jgi:hypothetical protein
MRLYEVCVTNANTSTLGSVTMSSKTSPEAGPLVVITGGLGRVASVLRPRLRGRYRLRLVDRAHVVDRDARAERSPTPGEELVTADIGEAGAAVGVLEGAEAVVHLAAIADPRIGWDEAYQANVAPTAVLLDAAATCGVPRVVVASSVHAMGEYNRPAYRPVECSWAPRPCCPYGLSKVVAEALARHHAETVGAAVVCLRLGLTGWPLTEERHLGMWLSDDDAGRLFDAALRAPVRFGVYFGVSANTRRHWRTDDATAELGYQPRDDSEALAPATGPSSGAPCRLYDDNKDPR